MYTPNYLAVLHQRYSNGSWFFKTFGVSLKARTPSASACLLWLEALKSGVTLTETERITSCTGCILSYFRLWAGNLLTYKDFWLFLTYQCYWNSPTVQELESETQMKPLDARWHFANLITWRKKKVKSSLVSRGVRKSSSSQHESQLVRQTESCTPCSEVLSVIYVCFVCRQQEGDDLLVLDAERKGMARKEGKVLCTECSLSSSQPRHLCISTAAPTPCKLHSG